MGPAARAGGQRHHGDRHSGGVARAGPWLGAKPSVILQEYIPPEHAEDWIVHLYRGAGGEPLVLFTGVKVQVLAAQAGMTACAYTVS